MGGPSLVQGAKVTEGADLPVVEIVVDPELVWIVYDGRPVLGMPPGVAAQIGPRLIEAAELYEKSFRAHAVAGNATVN